MDDERRELERALRANPDDALARQRLARLDAREKNAPSFEAAVVRAMIARDAHSYRAAVALARLLRDVGQSNNGVAVQIEPRPLDHFDRGAGDGTFVTLHARWASVDDFFDHKAPASYLVVFETRLLDERNVVRPVDRELLAVCLADEARAFRERVFAGGNEKKGRKRWLETVAKNGGEPHHEDKVSPLANAQRVFFSGRYLPEAPRA